MSFEKSENRTISLKKGQLARMNYSYGVQNCLTIVSAKKYNSPANRLFVIKIGVDNVFYTW